MNVVRKHKHFEVSNEYNALIKRIYPEPTVRTPFGSACVTIKAGTLSKPHLHHEHETFIILSGKGEFVQDAVRSEVSAGDVIYIKPFSEHYIQADTDSQLEFMSIWWEGKANPSAAEKTRQVIFTPPPTPNGDLHLGHIAGPYISADIIRRYLESQGSSVSLIVGTDKSQSYVDLKARQKNVSAQNVYRQYSQSIMQTFNRAGIGYDAVHDCDSPVHLEFVHNFIQHLLDKKIMHIKDHDSLYCEHCRIEVFDAFAKGHCPSCGASSNGCVCEDCGSPNNSYDLHDVSCNLCGGKPVATRLKKGVLDLAGCAEHFSSAAFEITAPAKLESYLRQQRKKDLGDYVVTFDSQWGVASRQVELSGQTYLAWIEMAAGYIAALYKSVFQEETTDVASAIQRLNATDFEIIHLMGFDNSFYYAYLYPRIWAALGMKSLRITFVVNEFLLLEQSKFSTSRNHAIWVNDVFTTPAVADWYRFYLTLQRPDAHRENYESAEFERFRNETQASISELFATHRLRLEAWFAGITPEPGSWTGLHQKYASFFERHKNHLLNALGVSNGYAVKHYAHAVKQLIDVLVRFQRLTACDFGASADPGERRTSLFLEAEAIELLRVHLGCIMPHAMSEVEK